MWINVVMLWRAPPPGNSDYQQGIPVTFICQCYWQGNIPSYPSHTCQFQLWYLIATEEWWDFTMASIFLKHITPTYRYYESYRSSNHPCISWYLPILLFRTFHHLGQFVLKPFISLALLNLAFVPSLISGNHVLYTSKIKQAHYRAHLQEYRALSGRQSSKLGPPAKHTVPSHTKRGQHVEQKNACQLANLPRCSIFDGPVRDFMK